MKQKKSKKTRSLLKGLSIGVCSLFLIVFALVSLPIRKTEAQRIPMPKEDGENQTHDAGPEVGVFYEQGRIRITDGEQTIYVKDRNQGAIVSVPEYEEAQDVQENIDMLYDIKDKFESCLYEDHRQDFMGDVSRITGVGEVTSENILRVIDDYMTQNGHEINNDIMNLYYIKEKYLTCGDNNDCKNNHISIVNDILGGDITEENIIGRIDVYMNENMDNITKLHIISIELKKYVEYDNCQNDQINIVGENLGYEVTKGTILNEIDDYISAHENYMGIEYEDTFGTYYYRGNNVGASRDEIHDGRCLMDEYCPPFIDEETYMRGFDGGKIGEPDTGREEGEYDNPCDITKGEYLPAAEDWQRMLDIYGNTMLDVKDDTIQSKKAGEDIRDVLRIPEAGNIYYFNKQAAKGGASELQDSNYVYKPISNKYIKSSLLWLALGENASEEGGAGKDDNDSGLLNKKGVTMRISVNGTEFYDKGNDVAAPVRCFIDPELSGQYYTINFETNGGSEIKSKLIKEGSEFSVSSIMEPEKDGYVFVGWYLDKYLTQQVDDDMVINQDTIIYAKRAEKGIFYRNGYIKVTNGEKSIYIKDRNQGAEDSIYETKIYRVSELSRLLVCRAEHIPARGVIVDEDITQEEIFQQITEIAGVEIRDCDAVEQYLQNPLRYQVNIEMKSKQCKVKVDNRKGGGEELVENSDCELDIINEITHKNFDDLDVARDYVDRYNSYSTTFGTYYYRGNNSGVNYNDLELDGGEILNAAYLNGIGFDRGSYIRSSNTWTEGSSDTPCDTNKGEYLPTVEDWDGAILLWGNVVDEQTMHVAEPESGTARLDKGGNELDDAPEALEERPEESILSQIIRNDKFLSDMLIPEAGYIQTLRVVQAIPLPESQKDVEEQKDEGYKKGGNGMTEGEDRTRVLVDEIEDDSNGEKGDCRDCDDNQTPGLLPKIFINNSIRLWTALDGGVSVGILSEVGLLDTNDMSYDEINNLAMPVRCFVKVNTVTLNINGGNRTEEIEIVGNQTLKGSDIEIPKIEGYTFLGWYMDSEYTKPFSDTDPITSDTILYARWQNNVTNTIEQPITTTNTNNGGRLKKDKCPGGDFSDSYYDGKCEKSTKTTHNASSTKSPYQRGEELEYDTLKYNPKYSDEMNQAYQYAYYYGITTKESIKSADVDGKLTRVAMAKMLSQYAINVLGMKPDNTVTKKFSDVSNKLDAEYDNGVTLAYQLGIMGINMPDNKFRPNDSVTRAEFVTALSRMKYGTKDGRDVYYSTHTNLLKDLGVITVTDPLLKETRGYVMLMLMRAK